jgi:DNA adenine methylase
MIKDTTAKIRQKRRKDRLADEGLYKRSILVHENCKAVFEKFKPYFADSQYVDALNDLFDEVVQIKPINVSKVRQLSPFRYPGGKTWLVPEIRKWIKSLYFKPKQFIEPFAGGAIVSLSIAIENLADNVIMSEIDPDVAAVWHIIFSNPIDLCTKIINFKIERENVRKIINSNPIQIEDRAFRTIIKNRTQRGGIIAPGASLVKSGENGKGLSSRWYPNTLVNRINSINMIKDKIQFYETDAFKIIDRHKNNKLAVFFIDPPYTAGGKKAGSRLYSHNIIDHIRLFDMMSKIKGLFLMTYDDTPEVIGMANKYHFSIHRIPMKNAHHEIKNELLIKKSD